MSWAHVLSLAVNVFCAVVIVYLWWVIRELRWNLEECRHLHRRWQAIYYKEGKGNEQE